MKRLMGVHATREDEVDRILTRDSARREPNWMREGVSPSTHAGEWVALSRGNSGLPRGSLFPMLTSRQDPMDSETNRQRRESSRQLLTR